jgi:hypothetical protein
MKPEITQGTSTKSLPPSEGKASPPSAGRSALAKTYLSDDERQRLRHRAIDERTSIAEILRSSLFGAYPDLRDA